MSEVITTAELVTKGTKGEKSPHRILGTYSPDSASDKEMWLKLDRIQKAGLSVWGGVKADVEASVDDLLVKAICAGKVAPADDSEREMLVAYRKAEMEKAKAEAEAKAKASKK